MHPEQDPNPQVTDPDLDQQPAKVPDPCRTNIRKTFDNNKMHLKSVPQLLIKFYLILYTYIFVFSEIP
jgi:hypothetical protein